MAFNTHQYIEAQAWVLSDKMSNTQWPSFLEFWGKPFWDEHAARVLPWYDPDCKALIIQDLQQETCATITMVVNALDILNAPEWRKQRWRIRGDSWLFYDAETVRLITEAQERWMPIDSVTLAVTPSKLSDSWQEKIWSLEEKVMSLWVWMKVHHAIDWYPHIQPDNSLNILDSNDSVTNPGTSIIAISPGWWSWKFGVLFSEVYKALLNWYNPNFIKFETFPAFWLPYNHPLNLAFEAATADLGNKVLLLENWQSWYDKDEDNFRLLRALYQSFWKNDLAEELSYSTDMGVNMIHVWIENRESITQACRIEIERRVQRYRQEVIDGNESHKTLQRALDILQKFHNMREIKTSIQ